MERNYSPSKGHKAPVVPKASQKKKTITRNYSPSKGQEVLEEKDDILDSVLDAAYGAAQGATFNLADEGYGAVKSLYEDGDLTNYKANRNEARQRWDEAKKRSPYLALGGEIVGGVASPVSKILGPAKGLKGIARGAVEGVAQASGASEEDFGSRKHLSDSAVGGAVGAATGVVSNVLAKGYKKEPNALRAEVTGTRAKDWKVSGPGDRRSSVDRLKDSGFYSRDKTDFDPVSLKFKSARKSKFRIDELEKNTEDRLLNRAEEAVKLIQQKKDREFGQLLGGRRVNRQQIDDMANELIDEYSERGLLKGATQRADAVEKVLANIDEQILRIGDNPNAPSLATLDKIKRMAQEDVKNFSKSLAELGDNEELMRITSRKLRAMVEDNLGSSSFTNTFKKYNGAQHDYLNVLQDLKGQISRLDLAPNQRIQLEKSNFAEQFVDSVTGGSDGKLMRAEFGDMVNKIPSPIRAISPHVMEETPGAIYRQRVQEPPIHSGRRPQSLPGVDTFGGQEEKEFNIPEELIRTPLPRSTNEFMEKKDFVLMKVAQMAPEHFETFKDTYENDPEALSDLLPVLATQAPHLFGRDKYDRFDGRVLTEKGRNRAMKDTLSREDLNSVQKAKILTKLNKDGVFE